jgi:hypothetical protein
MSQNCMAVKARSLVVKGAKEGELGGLNVCPTPSLLEPMLDVHRDKYCVKTK